MASPPTPDRRTGPDADARAAAEEAGTPFLVYRDGEGAQQIVTLDDAAPRITLGRRGEADVRLPWDGEVSRLHAELVPTAGEWTIADDGLSQNGTLVNEMPVIGRRRLRDGDLIRIGQTVLTFCAPRETGPVTLAPGKLTSALTFSESQQRILAALCRPLRDKRSNEPATDEAIAAAIGEPVELVASEIDHFVRTFGIGEMPAAERRAELALLALRAGLVSADG